MTEKIIRLKKHGDRRARGFHNWIYSNEIDTTYSPLKSFQPGEEVIVETNDQRFVGKGYINPHSLIAVRLYSFDRAASLNTDFLIEKISHALHFREAFFAKPYYRLVYSEADELPGLIIDRFGKNLVCQINTAGMENKKDVLSAALKIALPEAPNVLLRNDSLAREQEGLSTYVETLSGDPPDEVKLFENNVPFYAPIQKGQKTGWFYDHRDNRELLKRYVKGKTVLDVFSYLGAFGVQAAVFGASQVTCIDASKFACGYIQKNAALNQVEERVNVWEADAFDALKELVSLKRQFDVIILDPPAFVKKAKDQAQGAIAYQRINELAFKLLAKNGVLVTCSCSMAVSMDEFIEILRKAAARTHTQAQIIAKGHQGLDHPIRLAIREMDYLKALFIRKMDK